MCILAERPCVLPSQASVLLCSVSTCLRLPGSPPCTSCLPSRLPPSTSCVQTLVYLLRRTRQLQQLPPDIAANLATPISFKVHGDTGDLIASHMRPLVNCSFVYPIGEGSEGCECLGLSYPGGVENMLALWWLASSDLFTAGSSPTSRAHMIARTGGYPVSSMHACHA